MMAPRRGATLECGPLVGMRDSLDPKVSADPLRALTTQNMFPLELNKPSTFYGRPGFQQAGSQLGAVGKLTGQLVYQFTKLDGTEYTVCVVGGQGLYTFDWTLRTWTQTVTVANLTTASITLSETARVYAETYTDKMLISDGVNTPFLWDGTAGAGGLTKLTNAFVIYGQPRIHYAKIFGIKSATRNVLDWSEENQPNTGYESGGYNNSWQLGQTDQEGLYAIAATNDALYYLRARSIGAIRGAVTPEFTADGTHEGVSQNVGTASPDAVCIVDERVFFIDADARPHVIEGGMLRPLFDDIRETIRSLDRSKLSNAVCRYDATTGLVLFGVAENSQSNSSCVIAFNPVLNVPVSVWRGFTFTALGVVKNADGVPVLMHLSDDGYAYDHGTLLGSVFDDGLNAGTASIAHAVETCHLGADARDEKKFIRADVLFRAETEGTDIAFSTETPYGASDGQTQTVQGSGYRYDEDASLYDTATFGYDTIERKATYGFLQDGRWIRCRVSHEQPGEQFGFESVKVEFVSAGDQAAAA